MQSELLNRKARGAFYTPDEISRFIVDWAVRAKTDCVLEPSCGDAAFVVPAAERLGSLGATQAGIAKRLHAVDIHAPALKGAIAKLADHGYAAQFQHSDFFDVAPKMQFDAVIGNPPFVRYQQFTGSARAKGMQAALAQGVRLSQLASMWAAFTVHASQFLKDDGRLGFVLPGELLTVNYAADVRRFLLNRFASVRLVLFETLVFPGVLEEVVLLLAEGRGKAAHFEVHQARDVKGLAAIDATSWRNFSPEKGEKWSPAMLPADSLAIYRDALTSDGFGRLSDWGQTNLGMVTGNNNYFALTAEEVAKWELLPTDVVKISPPGARHLRGLNFTQASWRGLANDGARCYLFCPQSNPSDGAKRLIAAGRRQEVQKAYKCRVRNPWWRVPLTDIPDLFFTYMNHDRPRLTANDAGVHILNSLYGVKLLPLVRKLGQATLPIACLNSLTLVGSEIVGRAYGGGLLKHEPREADLLPVPSINTLAAVEDELVSLKPQLSTYLRGGKLLPASELVDDVLLVRALGMSKSQIKGLRSARETLMKRRVSRGKTGRGED